MATSGSSNFNQTRNDIINDAFSLIGVNSVGMSLSAEDVTLASRFLNKMVKAWGAQGLHLWAKTEGVVYLTPYVGEYTLSNDSTSAYFTKKDDEVVTQLTADVTTPENLITVKSVVGIQANDIVGIVLENGYIHWSTVAALLTPTTFTIEEGLPSLARSSALVYAFPKRAEKPLRILDARLIQGFDNGAQSSQTEINLTSIGYESYFAIGGTTVSSIPNQFCYKPEVNSGKLYVWPRPTNGEQRIAITYERIIEDLDTATDNFDFPNEWLECLTYQLAVRLGPMYGKDQRVMSVIAPLASIFLTNLLNWDNEITSITFGMDMVGME